MYLGGTEYRIHGTNDPTTIGKHVSSGCIRLTNDDVTDLYARVQVGAKVVVLPIGRMLKAPRDPPDRYHCAYRRSSSRADGRRAQQRLRTSQMQLRTGCPPARAMTPTRVAGRKPNTGINRNNGPDAIKGDSG